MKTNYRLMPCLAALGAAGFLAATASAQTTNNPNNFNDAASIASFVTWWTDGGVPNPVPITWDATQDAANDANSGSVHYEVAFSGVANDQFATWFSLANRWGWDDGIIIDGTIYTNVAFDIKVDPVSAITPGGNYGWLEVALVTRPDPDTYDRTTEKGINIPLSATNWTHVNMPIDITALNLDKIVGFSFRMWSDGAHTNSLIFNLDNVAMEKPEVIVPITPPTLALTKAVPGLAFVAASAGQYDRQEIRTVGSNYSWIGASGPVSYSVDVAAIGQNTPSNFQLFMHFVPGLPDPTRPDSDWHEPNVVMWRIQNNADGSGWSDLRFKTNAPDNNGTMWTDQPAGGGFTNGAWNATVAGTWTITFNQNTNIVITAPGGGSATNILPPEVVNIFNSYSPQMQFNVGVVPGELNRIGQMAIVNGVAITGTPGEPDLDSSFVGAPLDTNAWAIIATSPTFGVLEIPTDAPFWLNWTLPALNFQLQTTTTLGNGSWANASLPGFNAGGKHSALVTQDALPGSDAGFFRLVRQGIGVKLLVLLPGETLDPGTATGKTGTPDDQSVAVEFFDVTVQVVDKDNYPVNTANDEIHLTASGDLGTPFGNLPLDANLVNGSITLTVSILDEGTFTITASDVSDISITSGSSIVTVGP